MLFNSYIFLLVFLPLVLLGFFLIGRWQKVNPSLIFIALASLVFYGYFKAEYVALIVITVIVNYGIGGWIMKDRSNKKPFYLGVCLNILLLCYYKYTNFFIDNFNTCFGTSTTIAPILLPLGISFFTFQQISYLFDVNSGLIKDRKFILYFSYVVFFPQLISGPIVRYTDVCHQLVKSARTKLDFDHLCSGFYLFTLGLAKKVLIADRIDVYASPIFKAAEQGDMVYFIDSWYGALAYTCQIYFDFSGYSDMAVGLARMFNINIPINFCSPYKSKNFIEFWKRWHISLSICFQKYIYTPIGLAMRHWQAKTLKQYLPFFITMTVIGFWHGAGWNFVLWGFIHGLYIAINHWWRMSFNIPFRNSKLWAISSIGITFFCVVIVNVLFRASDMTSALQMYKGMLGMNGVILPYVLNNFVSFEGSSVFQFSYYLFPALHEHLPGMILITLLVSLLLIFIPRNSNDMLATFKPGVKNLIFMAILLFTCLIQMNDVSVFLYYQF